MASWKGAIGKRIRESGMGRARRHARPRHIGKCAVLLGPIKGCVAYLDYFADINRARNSSRDKVQGLEKVWEKEKYMYFPPPYKKNI